MWKWGRVNSEGIPSCGLLARRLRRNAGEAAQVRLRQAAGSLPSPTCPGRGGLAQSRPLLLVLSTSPLAGGPADEITFERFAALPQTAWVRVLPTPLPAWSDAPPSPRAGVNQLTWTGRSRDGGAPPKGPYLLEILAVEETGRAVRAVRAFWVR